MKDVEQEWTNFKQHVLPSVMKRSDGFKQQQEEKLNKRKQIDPLKPGDHVMAIDQTRGSKWDPKYEGPFIIHQQHEGGTYSLKNMLGDILPRRQTIDMLKPISQMVVTTPENEVQGNQIANNQFFEIQKILDHKQENNGYHYLIRWKGYSKEHDSWEPASNIADISIITKYWKKIKQVQRELRNKVKNKDDKLKNDRTMSEQFSTYGLRGGYVKPDIIPPVGNTRTREIRPPTRYQI